MSRRSWVTSSLVRRPEIFCWVFRGRTPRLLILFVGQILVSAVSRSTSPWRPLQNSSRSRPGFCFTEFFGPGGDAGDAGQPGQHRVPELLLQRSGDLGGDEGKLLLAGLVPGVDEAAQRPLRLHGPDGTGVGLGAVLVVAEQVLEACLVPGEVLPGLAEGRVGRPARSVFMLDEPGPF